MALLPVLSDQLRHPSAYEIAPEDACLARRCIDRCIADMGDRIDVAEALGVLPYIGHGRSADRGADSPVVRGGA